MTREEAIDLKAAVGRLMYSDNKDIRDYNALIDFIDTALRPVSREQVEKVRGEWIDKPTGRYGQWQTWCTVCGKHSGIGGIMSNRHRPFCPNCGAPMTDEAVDVMLKRMEEITNEH